ncbi:hypothetical protein BD413DRAFT_616040 [Trametes elegans]|nr:hypothetical protein BD413DRAFT_616040 [Trametes elegans]
MSYPQLPQELVDEIIDRVAQSQDNEDLRACARTSRSWLPRARNYLWSTVTLMEPRTVRAFAIRVTAPKQIVVDSVPLPPVGPMVRHLRLGVPMSFQEMRRRRNYGFSFSTIADIPTSALPNLVALSIAELPELWLHAQSMRGLAQSFASVTTLRIHKGLLLPDAVSILWGGFPRLESVHFEYDAAHYARDRLGVRVLGRVEPKARLPPSVRELGLGVPDEEVVEWLVRDDGLARDQLRALHILFQPLDDLRALRAMLHLCGRALEELSVGYADPPFVLPLGLPPLPRADFVQSIMEVFESLPLGENTALRALRVDGCEAIEHLEPPRGELYGWIPVLLDQIRSERVEKVTLAFRYIRREDPATLPWLDWGAIDRILASAPLDTVERVIIAVEQSEIAREAVYARVGGLLPSVARRGALCVRCDKELLGPEDRVRVLAANAPRYVTILDCVEDALSPRQAAADYADAVAELEAFQLLAPLTDGDEERA